MCLCGFVWQDFISAKKEKKKQQSCFCCYWQKISRASYRTNERTSMPQKCNGICLTSKIISLFRMKKKSRRTEPGFSFTPAILLSRSFPSLTHSLPPFFCGFLLKNSIFLGLKFLLLIPLLSYSDELPYLATRLIRNFPPPHSAAPRLASKRENKGNAADWREKESDRTLYESTDRPTDRSIVQLANFFISFCSGAGPGSSRCLYWWLINRMIRMMLFGGFFCVPNEFLALGWTKFIKKSCLSL